MTRQLDGTGMKRLHRSWRRQELSPLELLIDGVNGPFNLGAIIRTAAAYRVDHLWIAASQIDPTNDKVGKTALGTDRYVQWTAVESAAEALADIRKRSLRILGVELAEGAQPVHTVDLDGPVCLVIGHEDRGISKPTLEACDEIVYFPQLGKVGSLNIATAASLAIWEVRRAQLTSSD